MDEKTAELALAVIRYARLATRHAEDDRPKERDYALDAMYTVVARLDEILLPPMVTMSAEQEGTFADLSTGDEIKGKSGQWAEIIKITEDRNGITLTLKVGEKALALTKPEVTPVTFRVGPEARAFEILRDAFDSVEILKTEDTPPW